MSKPVAGQIFKNRFDSDYYNYLNTLLSDVDFLIQNASAPSKSGAYEKKRFERGIQLDFCGLAATTLLGIGVEDDEEHREQRMKVRDSFQKLLSSERVEALNEQGIYLKVRFVLSYIYSAYSSTLIAAESSFKRPYARNRAVDYSFAVEEEVSVEEIRQSTLAVRQRATLTEIARLVLGNPSLVMTKPEFNDNTLQVRFTLLPLPLCVFVCNNLSISDPYLYAQELTQGGKHTLFYHYPLMVFNKAVPAEAAYFNYLTNHFDYIWNNDLTLLCRDTTYFDLQSNCAGLASIRSPSNLKWTQKETRIGEHLKKQGKPFTKEAITAWREVQEKKVLHQVAPVALVSMEDEIVPIAGLSSAPKNSRLKIWIDQENNYCFDLAYEDYSFSYQETSADAVFKLMLHYGYAKKKGRIPVMHKNLSLKIFSEIVVPLSRRGNKPISTPFLTKNIFQPNNDHAMAIAPDDVSISETLFDQVRKLKYSTLTASKKNTEILNKRSVWPVLWYSDEDDKYFMPSTDAN